MDFQTFLIFLTWSRRQILMINSRECLDISSKITSASLSKSRMLSKTSPPQLQVTASVFSFFLSFLPVDSVISLSLFSKSSPLIYKIYLLGSYAYYICFSFSKVVVRFFFIFVAYILFSGSNFHGIWWNSQFFWNRYKSWQLFDTEVSLYFKKTSNQQKMHFM